ncbi:MAG: glycosyltransferase 61 family protein [Microcoleaceae cyanobacterium MO_207.B10]|nr:glycosyltransferase 61 family protein [Microcoleaceae cyanobacterium MO_207.B10]
MGIATYITKDALYDLKELESFQDNWNGDAVIQVHEKIYYSNPEPLFVNFSEEIGELTQRILAAKRTSVDPIYCARVNNATLIPHANIFTADDSFLWDLSRQAARHFLDSHGKQIANFTYPEPEFINNSVGLLSMGHNNQHSHWLLQTLPKLEIFKKAGIRPQKLVVQPTIKGYQKKALAILGYPEKDLIIGTPKQPLRCAELYATNIWGGEIISDLDIYNELSVKCPPTEPGPERIYVSRQDSRNLRRFLNEEKVIELMKEYDFEIVIPSKLTIEEEVNIFRNAKVVVGALGAGLYNTIFTEPGANIIVLSDPWYVTGWILNIAALRHHNIGFVFGHNFLSFDRVHYGRCSNWIVDTNMLREAIENVLDTVD